MYPERKKLYQKIEALRKRPLITYATSIRPNMGASMAGDAIASIIEQIECIPENRKEIDFMLISNGGDPISALRIITLLRERFDRIAILLPYVAYSAATILALGGDEIIMHPYSNLGPVDPQLNVSHNNEKGMRENLQFGSEDLRNYIEFLREDAGIQDQEHMTAALQPLLKDVGSIPIGRAKRGQQLSMALSEKMLSWHMKDKEKASEIAKKLNSSYYHHGYAVGRTEAKELGLPVTDPGKELQQLMWAVWQNYSSEMKCDQPFDPMKEIFDDPEANSKISQVPVLNFPANTPPDVAQQIIVRQAQNTQVTTRSALKLEVMLAGIESASLAKAVYNRINVVYWRKPDMTLGVNCTLSATGWIRNRITAVEERRGFGV